MFNPTKINRILFADDDPDDHYLFRTALNEVDNSIQIQQFYKCDEIMDHLNGNDPPDIIFLDLNMPGNQDFQCLKELKQQARLQNIPVVIYTTSHHKEIIDAAYNYGANKFLVKPGSIGELQKMLREIVEVK